MSGWLGYGGWRGIGLFDAIGLFWIGFERIVFRSSGLFALLCFASGLSCVCFCYVVFVFCCCESLVVMVMGGYNYGYSDGIIEREEDKMDKVLDPHSLCKGICKNNARDADLLCPSGDKLAGKVVLAGDDWFQNRHV